ncbi:hypothetical protein [Cellulomonas soli]|uniref:hypothetical protein n=1 Tax=Cellulomonas soli TaxID=931535 RepID=UPI0011BD665D|nr:hypothetical protein [Cellulomonas soli]NYI59467.1 hypothetical protein [Cellulomonas soli]
MTSTSEHLSYGQARTGALPRLTSSGLPVRAPVARVRVRVRIPSEVLEAAWEGLQNLDDVHQPVLRGPLPPRPVF